jgi:short-subunit dehydrogenase
MTFFDGCTALITGASSGLGTEFAQQLAPHAGKLVLTARRVDRLEALKQALEAEYPELQVFIYGVDLANEAKVDDFLQWLSDAGLRVNFLVNNAGLGDYGPFIDSEWAKVRQVLEVNVQALTKLTHALLPTLREYPVAAILNVSSVASLLPLPDTAVYAASKAYVTSFSEALRAELRGTGVSVTALCPGPVDTEFGAVAERSADQPMPVPDFFKVSAEQVVADGLRAVAGDRARIIPGWRIALAMTLTVAVPMVLLRLVLNHRPKEWFHPK